MIKLIIFQPFLKDIEEFTIEELSIFNYYKPKLHKKN